MKRVLFLFIALLSASVVHADSGETFIRKHKCNVCHKIDINSIGPALLDIANRYDGDLYEVEHAAERIKNGSKGNWGTSSMIPNPSVSEEEVKVILEYIQSLER